MEEMYPLISKMIEIKGEVTFTVSGWSMQPMVYHRRDTVTLVKAELPLKKYDLPFYLMDNGRFLLHRVVKVEKQVNENGVDKYIYTCQGDNRWEPETGITDEMIIGVVKSFNRNGKEHSVNSFGYWLYTRTWVVLHHFKWMYNFPKRTKAKIKNSYKRYNVNKKLRDKVLVGENKLKIEYRPAKTSDLANFYKIFEKFAVQETEDYKDPIANTKWISTEGAKQYYNKLRQEQFFWVAVEDNKIIGFCTGTIRKLEPLGINVGNLVNIYIDEKYRSLGIGTKLVNTFKEYCKQYDCNNMTVTFLENNERAEKFYARHGFNTHKRTYLCNF